MVGLYEGVGRGLLVGGGGILVIYLKQMEVGVSFE